MAPDFLSEKMALPLSPLLKEGGIAMPLAAMTGDWPVEQISAQRNIVMLSEVEASYAKFYQLYHDFLLGVRSLD